MNMAERKYGAALVAQLDEEITRMQNAMVNRMERINAGMTDIDDCFLSDRREERGIANNQDKIDLINNGGCMWFTEYATLDGTLVDARWCNTKFGSSLRVKMPNGDVVWTTATTDKGLAKKGLKRVECKRPAWFKFSSGGASGLLGVYTGSYVPFPSDVNYATGEAATSEPIEVREYGRK